MGKLLANVLASLALIILGMGCQAVQPVRYFVRTGPTYSTTMPAVDNLGVFVDAAVDYDRVSTNYFDLEDSRAAITNLVHETQQNLQFKGYHIAFTESPFVGSFKPSNTNYLVAERRKGTPSLRSAPFESAPALDADPRYRTALLTASRGIFNIVQNRGEMPTELLHEDEPIREALETIATNKNVQYMLLVLGDGKIVSGGKQAGQEIGTALLSSVITLGAVTVVAHNVSMLKSTAVLVDLRHAEVVWCNWLPLAQFNPVNGDSYKYRWPRNVLHWLPPRGKLEAIDEPNDRPQARSPKGRS